MTVSLILSSCSSYEPPDYEALKASFTKSEDTYLELMKMIAADTAVGNCGSISDDHVMGWWEYSGLWNTSQDYDRKVELPIVLSEVGISKERYTLYLEKLSLIGAEEGVSHCNELETIRGTKAVSTRFGLSASGLSVSGCTTHIVHRGNEPIPESEETPGYFYKRVPIDENWYIEHGCT